MSAEVKVGRLQQNACVLCTGSPGDRQGPGADNTGQHPMYVTLAESELRGKPRHALAIDHAVGNQPHRAADRIGTKVPLGRSRRSVRPAALARAKARRLRRGCGRVELHVRRLRSPRRTARAAVDPGGGDAGVEPAVKSRVLVGDGAPAALIGREVALVHSVHAGILARPGRRSWRISDMTVSVSDTRGQRGPTKGI